MENSLHYIGISYRTASVTDRETYHISEKKKNGLVEKITSNFSDIKSLFLLVTCNRTEVYFESKFTSASVFLDFFIEQITSKDLKKQKHLFELSDNTKETVHHILKVASGLSSAVVGDMEIVHQVKKAYQFSMTHQLQGSLLERCMQTVFKSHKRISNETDFKDGTTSTAYKSLKVVNETFPTSKENKILIIGAGDIVKQLLRYNEKFNFDNVFISNRTEAKARKLALKYQCSVYDWNETFQNNFDGFDVIISAVSNCHNLINSIDARDKILLIDLAVPSNINKSLSNNDKVIFYDLDSISMELENNREKRKSAIVAVNNILNEEKLAFERWIEKASLRDYLARNKIIVKQKIKDYLAERLEDNNQWDKIITNRVMKRLIKQYGYLGVKEEIDDIINEELTLLEIPNEGSLLVMES